MDIAIQKFVQLKHAAILDRCKKVVLALHGDLDSAQDISQEVCLKLLQSKGLRFPEDEEKALQYVGQMAKHYWFKMKKKQNKQPVVEINESHEELIHENHNELQIYERRLPGIKGLQTLNKRIVESGLFTPSQVRLWECIMQGKSTRIIAEELGLARTRVATYQHKLFLKIRSKFNRKEFL